MSFNLHHGNLEVLVTSFYVIVTPIRLHTSDLYLVYTFTQYLRASISFDGARTQDVDLARELETGVYNFAPNGADMPK